MLLAYLFNYGYSACSYAFTDIDGTYYLNMACLDGTEFDVYDEPYHFLYTPCQTGMISKKFPCYIH